MSSPSRDRGPDSAGGVADAADRAKGPIAPVRIEGVGLRQALEGLHARGYRPRVVFDVGAAVGSWTRTAIELWPEARYVLFEALEERRPDLEALAATSGTRIEVLIGGLGNVDGPLSFGITDGLFDSSFAYSGTRSRQVECWRLDTLYRERRIPAPDFLKMDVQGFELSVLEGGCETMAGCGVILMECQFFAFCPTMYTLDRTIAAMSSLGFVPYEFVDFLRRPLDGAMGQCDLLFVRRGHWLVSDRRWA